MTINHILLYNAKKQLSQISDSVLDQIYTNWELVLINDISIDTTNQIVSNYLKKRKRIRCSHQSDSGPSLARKKGKKQKRIT